MTLKKIVLLMVLFYNTSEVLAKSRNISVIGFIENKGQIIDQNNQLNTQVKFLGVANGFKVQLKANSFSYEVLKTERYKYLNPRFKSHKHSNRSSELEDSTVIFSHRIDIELLNANPHPEIIASEKSHDYLNYYTTGTPENGITEVYSFSKVMYKNIYPHIDLEFVVDDGLKQPYKYNFIVHPGGNVNDIQLHFVGANRTELMNGCIQIDCNSGSFNESIPMSYEIESGRDVTVNYNRLGKDTYGFQSPTYNKQNSLIIDPWATYFGGEGTEDGAGISCDNLGNINVIGNTNSLNNIATIGVYQSFFGGIWDVYVAQFNVNGNRSWATFYGGSSGEDGYGISSDSDNNVVIVGGSSSNNNIASIGAYQATNAGNGDIFIAKFNSSGIRKWGTYYGGSGSEHGFATISDKSNNIIVVGESSSNGIASVGAHQITLGDNSDAIIIKLDSNGNRLWATYYGGTNPVITIGDRATSVAVDLYNNIVVAGYTHSLNNISTIGCHQDTLGGGFDDGFVVKFNSAGVRQWGTYFGGSHEDEIRGVAVDASNNIVIGGFTGSPNNIATSGSFKSTTTTANAFLAKFNSSGTRIWGTYYGGTGNGDYGNALATGDSNTIVLAGYANSLDSIATTGSYKDTLTPGPASLDYDAYLVKFDSNGNRIWGSYFGGEGDEDAINGVDVANNGDIVITGNTNSSFGIATPNAFQTSIDSVNMYDAFIASFNSSGQLTTAVPYLNSFVKNNLLQVYPNPTKDKIVVHLKSYTGKEGSLKLQTIEGKLLKQFSVKAEETSIDLKELAIGVYLLEYSDGEVCESVKLVKE